MPGIPTTWSRGGNCCAWRSLPRVPSLLRPACWLGWAMRVARAVARASQSLRPPTFRLAEFTTSTTQRPTIEALLLHLSEGQFVAYSSKCTHLSCAVYWQAQEGRLLCPCHEGEFSPPTGDAIKGPPSRPLPKIVLEEQDGMIFAVKELLS